MLSMALLLLLMRLHNQGGSKSKSVDCTRLPPACLTVSARLPREDAGWSSSPDLFHTH